MLCCLELADTGLPNQCTGCCHAGTPEAPVLLSAGKDSKQSSTSGALSAGLANDGISSSQASMCATTNNQGSQYWQVDLGDLFRIVNVTLLNR